MEPPFRHSALLDFDLDGLEASEDETADLQDEDYAEDENAYPPDEDYFLDVNDGE